MPRIRAASPYLPLAAATQAQPLTGYVTEILSSGGIKPMIIQAIAFRGGALAPAGCFGGRKARIKEKIAGKCGRKLW